MTFSEDEAGTQPTPTETPPATDGSAGGTTGATGTTGTTGTTGGTGFLDDLGPEVRAESRPLTEQIWAVQQIYALRRTRFEIQPTVGISLNDPYVSHTGGGLAINYWISNVLAAGVNFMWFQGLNQRSEIDFQIARSARVVVPINEYQMLAGLNFTYVPLYGKFLMFSQYIFHWDLYVLAGVGLIRTRPIPVVDPEVRSFQYDNNIMFSAAVGLRVFVNRWFGIVGEVRNYIYPERLEALDIGRPDQPVTDGMAGVPCGEPGGPVCNSRQDPATWYGATALTDNVMVQVGITVFLPFGVSYRLLK